MIKLTAVENQEGYRLRLTFSDGSWGVYDFTHFIDARTPMTEPLADATFFTSHFIEMGALCWPNGFDLSAASLQQSLRTDGLLRGEQQAA